MRAKGRRKAHRIRRIVLDERAKDEDDRASIRKEERENAKRGFEKL